MKWSFVPTPNLFKIFLAPLLVTLLGIINPVFLRISLLLDLGIIIICIQDLAKMLNGIDYQISLKKKANFHIDCTEQILFQIDNTGKVDLDAEMMLDLPRFWAQKGGPLTAAIPSGESVDIPFMLHSGRRGRYTLEKLNIRFLSPAKLFRLYRGAALDVKIDVYPDISELKEYFIMARNNRLFEMGIHKNRYRGRGTEIESLREYSKDDDSRLIDWKASARANKPVSRVFQMESMNDVVFVLDCGRLMTSEEGKLSSLDLAINALLVLSHITISMGDRIRIIPFSDHIIGDYTSARGKNPMQSILKFITPIQAEFVESNYPLVFAHLQATIKKRSLIIFVSDIMDDINYSMFKKNFSLLGKKHSLLFMLLRDELLQQEANRASENLTDIYSTTAARSMVLKRNQSIMKLKHSGIRVMDILPKNVTARLVDKYLELKASNQI
ncbi:MAG: DUF58 domain-containing protein [Spirochaetales bacterium]|nr:DUF58 domain-containing protein [Spirochaetales bacterium]